MNNNYEHKTIYIEMWKDYEKKLDERLNPLYNDGFEIINTHIILGDRSQKERDYLYVLLKKELK